MMYNEYLFDNIRTIFKEERISKLLSNVSFVSTDGSRFIANPELSNILTLMGITPKKDDLIIKGSAFSIDQIREYKQTHNWFHIINEVEIIYTNMNNSINATKKQALMDIEFTINFYKNK